MPALTFSDVLIVPKYSEVESRKDVEISVTINKNFKLSLPVVSANMKSITGYKMAVVMAANGGLGILHRFMTVEENVSQYKTALSGISHNKMIAKCADLDAYEIECVKNSCGVSIGVQEDDKKRFDALHEAGARIFCLDVAHGHSKKVKDMLWWLKGYNDHITVIAGNVATGDGAYDLADWGADIIKVGIGPGHACTTRRATGVGVPQLHAIREAREEFDRQGVKKSLISDGGIETVGDICKALKYADAVMVGNFLSGVSETPGNVFRDENQNFYKVYQGSASGENKNESGYAAEYIEGISKKVPFRGHVKHILREIEQGIKSSCSYVGAFNLEQFKEKCEFTEISAGGKAESKL